MITTLCFRHYGCAHFYKWGKLRIREIIWLCWSYSLIHTTFLTGRHHSTHFTAIPTFSQRVLISTPWNSQMLSQKILLNAAKVAPKSESMLSLFCSPRCRESWFQMSREEYFYHLSAKRYYQRKYSVSRKKSQPMNSLTYRLYTKIKTGYLCCCLFLLQRWKPLVFPTFLRRKTLRIDTESFSMPKWQTELQMLPLWYDSAGGHLDPGSLRQSGCSFTSGQCISTQKLCELIVTMTETGCWSFVPSSVPSG